MSEFNKVASKKFEFVGSSFYTFKKSVTDIGNLLQKIIVGKGCVFENVYFPRVIAPKKVGFSLCTPSRKNADVSCKKLD